MKRTLEADIETRQQISQYLRILARRDPVCIKVVNAALAGRYSCHQIAAHAGLSPSTVHKKLKQMRALWQALQDNRIWIDPLTDRVFSFHGQAARDALGDR
jgi:hypothetical protein